MHRPNPGLFTEKILHIIKEATYKTTTFHQASTYFEITKVTSASPLTFYAQRNPEHCQPYYARTTIPGSSIGDISPCVEQLSVLSSQSFTNERLAYQPVAHGVPPYGMVCLLHW